MHSATSSLLIKMSLNFDQHAVPGPSLSSQMCSRERQRVKATSAKACENKKTRAENIGYTHRAASTRFPCSAAHPERVVQDSFPICWYAPLLCEQRRGAFTWPIRRARPPMRRSQQQPHHQTLAPCFRLCRGYSEQPSASLVALSFLRAVSSPAGVVGI